MNLFDRESPLGRLLSCLGDLIVLNLVWILGCLPIFTVGASTVALYTTARKLAEGNCDSVLRIYWREFRLSGKKATAAFAVLTILGVAVAADLRLVLSFSNELPLWIKILAVVPAAVFILVAGYVFPLQAWFEHTVRGTLFNSLVLSFVHLPISLAVAALNLLPVILLLLFPCFFSKCLPAWILFGFSLTAFLNTLLLGKVFRLYVVGE